MESAATPPSVLGEFQIVAVLGRGGSGTVYDAIWGPRRVALKVLRDELLGTAKERAQFLAEARRLQAIVHPSVVKVLAVGELPDRRPYLAMERLEGETLASVLARGPVALGRALELFSQLCAAVATLHDQGMIHRDLKPENVFVVADQHAVLLDFGIAKELDAPASTTTQDGAVRGTPAYMAPERFFGSPAGVATDVYELAVILYAMVAGRLPWDNIVDPEARLQPRPLTGVPPELDVEIRRAMSTRAQNRPATAMAFLASIRTAAATVPNPIPSETAPMAQAGAPPTSAEPWFAERKPETDRGKTPLAWAPTAAAPALARPRRKRWLWVAAAMAVAATVIALAATRHDEPAPAPIASTPITHSKDGPKDQDPWGGDSPPDAATVEPPPKSIAVDTNARREAAAAFTHLPADTRVVFTMIKSEIVSDRYLKAMLDKIIEGSRAELLIAFTPPCAKKLLAQASWMTYGMVALDQFNGVLVAGGGMSRADIEACFAADATQVAMPDGVKLFRLHNAGFVDFIDDRTVMVAMRKDLSAAKVHELAKTGGGGASPRATQLVAELPANRALSLAVDGHDAHWPTDVLPKGADLSTWIRVLKDGVYMDFTLDAHDEAAAKSFESQIRPQIDELFANTDAEALGKLEVIRETNVVRVRGKLTALILSLAVSQL